MANKSEEKKALQKRAMELNIPFTNRTSAEKLQQLIAEAEATPGTGEGSVPETDAPEEGADGAATPAADPADEPAASAPNEPAPAAPKRVETRHIEGPIRVVRPDGSVRVYSRAVQGKHYKILAKQHAEHVGGTIV